MSTSKGRPCHDRLLSNAELGLIYRFGTEEAWIEHASKATNSSKLVPEVQKSKPWRHTSLCTLNESFQLVLIERVLVRLPDKINELANAEIVRIVIDSNGRKDVIRDRTQWIRLKGNESKNRFTVTFSQKSQPNARRRNHSISD